MLKLIGSACVIAACTLIGNRIAKTYAMRPLQIRQLLQSLQYLETEIVYACTPLHLAFLQVGKKINGVVGEIFKNAGESLQNHPSLSAKSAWEKAVEKNISQIFFKNQEELILDSFFTGLGHSQKEDELKQIKLAQDLLRAELERALEDSKKFGKLYNTLGVSIGLVITIILL